MFLSCKYEKETIEKYFAKTIHNRKLYGDTLPFEKGDQQRANIELYKLKLKLETSKYYNYDKIWKETIGEICGEDKNLKVLFIDQIDYLYLKKGWDLEKNLKKLAKYAKVENICIVINCAIPPLKKLKMKKLYEMNFLKRMNLQHDYFDKIIYFCEKENLTMIKGIVISRPDYDTLKLVIWEPNLSNSFIRLGKCRYARESR
jgi:hypothetical protein